LNFLYCLLPVDQSAPSKEQLHAPLHSDHLIQTQLETYAAFDCVKYTWGGIPYLRESGNGVHENYKTENEQTIKKKVAPFYNIYRRVKLLVEIIGSR
jgi:hypothetical protein